MNSRFKWNESELEIGIRIKFCHLFSGCSAWLEELNDSKKYDYHLFISTNFPRYGDNVLYQDFLRNDEVDNSIIKGIKEIHQKTSNFLNSSKEER
jgi:hypothetical protein